jgi:hypothetical protein
MQSNTMQYNVKPLKLTGKYKYVKLYPNYTRQPIPRAIAYVGWGQGVVDGLGGRYQTPYHVAVLVKQPKQLEV